MRFCVLIALGLMIGVISVGLSAIVKDEALSVLLFWFPVGGGVWLWLIAGTIFILDDDLTGCIFSLCVGAIGYVIALLVRHFTRKIYLALTAEKN